MDLTWGAIFKVIIAGLGTYTVLPAFLILRDYLIWKLIGAYILNDDLQSKIKQFVFLTTEWNTKYCKNATRTNKDGIEVYIIDGQPATKGEFDQYLVDMDRVSKLINELDLFINRKSRFLNWMLKHYKQEGSNPIQAWKDKELERLNCVKWS
ncbi:hypothetical protein [Glaciecola sp. 1036]|uniref:hypothetical protein n=1 Tax=Alteromonadaceae TaxID=72275 RepID=UPI003CFF9904